MSFSCPKCNSLMIQILEQGKYVSHACIICKLFFELENIKEFQ